MGSGNHEWPLKKGSAWTEAQMLMWLDAQRIPLRIAVQGDNGIPLMCPLWYYPAAGSLWCATHRSAHIVSLLERAPAVAWEVAPNDMPYCGVRGQADVNLHADKGEAVLRRLIDRYLGSEDNKLARFLLSRVDGEYAVELKPRWISSWDYGDRMSDLESAGD